MKNIKLIVTLAAVLVPSGFACAQTAAEPKPAAQDELRGLLKKLNLTPEQCYVVFSAQLDEMDNYIYEGAAKHLDKLLQKSPTARLYYEKGIALGQIGKNEEAVKAFTKAMEKDPKYFQYPMSRCGVYRVMKLYDKAIADATKAIELDNGRTYLPFHQRAVVYLQMEDYKNAAQDFGVFLAGAPEQLVKWVGIDETCQFLLGKGFLVNGCPKPAEKPAEKPVPPTQPVK